MQGSKSSVYSFGVFGAGGHETSTWPFWTEEKRAASGACMQV
jgi:hypothetical protein